MTGATFEKGAGILGARYPVMLAGMGGIAGPELVAAVSNAGGIGTLGLYKAAPPRIAELIKEVRARTTRVFGTNFVPEVVDEATLITNVTAAIECSDVGVFMSFFGMPPSSVAKLVKDRGRSLVIQVGSTQEAEQAVALGVDVLIIQGTEAGGHLLGVHGIADIVKDVRSICGSTPLFVAGGVSNAADFDQLVGNGPADGVCCGTLFVATAESNAHDRYKQLIVESGRKDTVITDIFEVGWPGRRHRVVNTDQVRNGTSVAASVIARTRIYGTESLIFRYSAAVPTTETVGNIDDMALYCGVSCQSITDSRVSAADVIASLVGNTNKNVMKKRVSHGL